MSILHIIFAAFGLGLIIFLHELGHYIAAVRSGMRVEAFSIGFGKSIFTWNHNGVAWKICILPFGGYVKIAGTEANGDIDPHLIPDGFFGKSPWARIKVAFAGPLVNFVLAILLFGLIWVSGGREKPFSEFTKVIGSVDPKSELYAKGVRPGDLLEAYNGHPFKGNKDLLFAAMLSGKTLEISGKHVDPLTGNQTPFNVTVSPYQHPYAQEGISTFGVLTPARYLIYTPELLAANPAIERPEVVASGLKSGDRLLMADGVILYSMEELFRIINEPVTLLTVQRGEKTQLVRAPRVRFIDLKLYDEEKSDLQDQHFEAKISKKLTDTFLVPYTLNDTCVVTAKREYLDQEIADKYQAFDQLLIGDKVIAIDGVKVNNSKELWSALQTRKISLIVERDPVEFTKPLSWTDQDHVFEKEILFKDLNLLASTLGVPGKPKSSGSLHILSPIEPVSFLNLPMSEEQKTSLAKQFSEDKLSAEKIENTALREKTLQEINASYHRLVLGIRPLVDRQVEYNPNPIALFCDSSIETLQTLKALVMGNLNPKWIGVGPIGIVDVLHKSWGVSIQEALFWMGVISVTLGLLNLLPIPVLDGGHILFSLIEWVRGKPIKVKTMERWILPFVVLLIALFVFATYQDISRLISRIF